MIAASEDRFYELQVSLQVVGLNLVGQNLGIQTVGTPTLAFTLEAMEPTSLQRRPRYLLVLGKKVR